MPRFLRYLSILLLFPSKLQICRPFGRHAWACCCLAPAAQGLAGCSRTSVHALTTQPLCGRIIRTSLKSSAQQVIPASRLSRTASDQSSCTMHLLCGWTTQFGALAIIVVLLVVCLFGCGACRPSCKPLPGSAVHSLCGMMLGSRDAALLRYRGDARDCDLFTLHSKYAAAGLVMVLVKGKGGEGMTGRRATACVVLHAL